MEDLHVTARRNPEIRYINPQLPDLEPPLWRGNSYRAKVPDTLDLGERAREAVRGLVSIADPEANGEIYWLAAFGWKPLGMYHDMKDWCEFKFWGSSQLLRQACGSDEGLDIEWHRMANLFQMQGPDGFLYLPLEGRPWGRQGGDEAGLLGVGSAAHFVPVVFQGRLLSNAAVYHRLTGDNRWRDLGEKLLGALWRTAIDQGGFAYYQDTCFEAGQAKKEVPVPPPCIGFETAWIGNGLMDYYRMTGSEQALELAYKLARFHSTRHSGFVGPDGEFQTSHIGRSLETAARDFIHFHCNTHVRLLMLDAGLAKGDREMIELARRGYEFGKAHGDTLLGCFPENVAMPDPDSYGNTTEICEVAEMIYLALRQSTAGLADCWDDVDRWMRNMFAESQLLETDWAYEFCDKYGVPLDRAHGYVKNPAAQQTYVTERAAERFRGTWGGWLWPNEWQGDLYQRSVMTCCVGNMSMHFYRVWRDMVSFDENKNRFSAHLLMNRASRWADVDSYIPCRGEVRVHPKRDCEVALRIPEWTQPEDCRFTVDGTAASAAWEDRYGVVRASNGQTVALHCPIAERTEKRNIIGKDFTVTVRGNEVVDIDPPGRYCPLFQRPEYRGDDPGLRTVERFVADEEVGEF